MGYNVLDSSDYSECYSDTNDVQLKKTHRCLVPGCGATFSKNSKLIYHNRKHTGERPFVCDQPGCNKSYTNSSHLRRHKKVSHEKISQEVICGYDGCGLVISNKYNLKKHINRKHNPERKYPFVCTICLEGFLKKKQLQEHTYGHTGETPFRCDQCSLSFTTNYLLKKHKRNHRTYTCEYCNEVFYRWTVLLAHRKKCRSPRFSCKDCGKTFNHLGNFKSHLATHEEKNKKMVYPCSYKNCSRFYFYKKNLKVHLKTFHENRNTHLQLKCSYGGCNVVLKTLLSHKRHLLRHSLEKKKTVRRVRKDKGKKKYLMAGILCGLKIPCKDEEESKRLENVLPLDSTTE